MPALLNPAEIVAESGACGEFLLISFLRFSRIFSGHPRPRYGK
jgi:hypothetical protein